MLRVAGLDNSRFRHFQPEVVAFARAFADAGKYGKSSVLLGDVIDQFHDDDGLAHASATEQTDFSALQEWLDEVDDLHTKFRTSSAVVACSSNSGAGRWIGTSACADRAELIDRFRQSRS